MSEEFIDTMSELFKKFERRIAVLEQEVARLRLTREIKSCYQPTPIKYGESCYEWNHTIGFETVDFMRFEVLFEQEYEEGRNNWTINMEIVYKNTPLILSLNSDHNCCIHEVKDQKKSTEFVWNPWSMSTKKSDGRRGNRIFSVPKDPEAFPDYIKEMFALHYETYAFSRKG